MAERRVIGLAGHIGVGKSMIANYLVRKHGFHECSFSTALKWEVLRNFRRTLHAYVKLAHPTMPLNISVTHMLFDQRDEVTRALLQEYGTEVRRAQDPDYWVKLWRNSITVNYDRPIVAADVRFPNEAEAIRREGGQVWLVTRPERVGDYHSSETSLVGWTEFDRYVRNEWTPEKTYATVDLLLGE